MSPFSHDRAGTPKSLHFTKTALLHFNLMSICLCSKHQPFNHAESEFPYLFSGLYREKDLEI